MADIVVSEFMSERAVRRLEASHAVRYDASLVERRDDLLGLLGSIEALIVRNATQVDRALLDAAPRLRCVGRLGVGLDNIDLKACRARNVAVLPATGANDDAVAEYVIAAALVLRRRQAFALKSAVLDGAWPRREAMGDEVQGARLALLGFGAIAQKTARRAQALGMEVSAFDPYAPEDEPRWALARRCDSLDALLKDADILSLHTPLTGATRRIVDAKALAKLPRHAIVINAARGGVLDDAALANALRAGALAGAALDVYEEEPLTRDAAQRFRGLDQLILTPHVAGVTTQSNERVSEMIADKVLEALAAPRHD